MRVLGMIASYFMGRGFWFNNASNNRSQTLGLTLDLSLTKALRHIFLLRLNDNQKNFDTFWLRVDEI